MKLRQVSLLLAALCALICCQIHAQAPSGTNSPTKSALLIGIDIYSHTQDEIKVPDGAPRTGRYDPQLPLTFSDLKGPTHDVDAMRELLTSDKYGFPNDDQHIHILLNQAATHDAILQAMQQYLVKDPKPGDTVVLYVSSHGSLRADPKADPNKCQRYSLDDAGRHPTCVENTIVPYDWYLGQDDIFSRDLRHIFNQAADRGIQLTAIFDSCHSGSLARGAVKEANEEMVPRAFAIDPRPMPDNPYPAEAAGTPPEIRADNPVLVLSAAQKDQEARDNPHSVPPHGLFTSALIETLQALPANRPASDVFKRLQIAMELAPDAARQQPELDTSIIRKEQPLFGGAAGSGPPTTTIVSVDANDVLLDIGTVANIGPGSEFTELTETNGVRAVLQVTDSIGLARSRAKVISPVGAKVQAKDIVQVSIWVPAQRPTLNFYAGVSNPSLAEIQDALTVLHTAGVKLAGDPSSDPWTYHLAWDGTHWTLSAHSQKVAGGQVWKDKPTSLGARLSPTASALKKLPPTAIVWFDAPLPKESVPGLLPPPNGNEPPSAAQLTNDRAKAKYVIAGSPTDNGIKYAWFNRGDVDAEVQTPNEIGPGCSPSSPYPLRTNWAVLDKTVQLGSVLTDSAVQLARLNGWLDLESSSMTGQADFPYRLTLRREAENQDIADHGTTYKGNYQLWLVGKPRQNVTPRWVYVLGIDCQGKGTLLWPYDDKPDGQFPTADNQKPEQILLPYDPFPVGDPLGTDTYILLTTSTQLNERLALEFTGVVTKGGATRSAAPADPLEDLLDTTSAGTRSADRPRQTPTNWSIQAIETQSLPEPPTTSANGKTQ
jgi:hypothetical protein